MKILVTGNLGYVGPAVARHLRATFPDAVLHGYDNGYFAHCLTGVASLPERELDAQFFGDVRDLTAERLEGYDAVVQLAAVSNDPMGNKFEKVTSEINYESSIRLARLAAAAGVKNYVFASSCSVYGVADGPARREQDPVNPITAYAKSKIGTENDLQKLNTGMVVTALTFSPSPAERYQEGSSPIS